MFAKFLLTTCSSLLVLLAPATALAETVIEKVVRTGTLTVGAAFDVVPYSYVEPDGDLVGYSIDVARLVEAQLEKEIDRDINLEVVEVESLGDQIAQLRSGNIDLACSTRFTWIGDRFVDYSISYGLSGIRLLTPSDSTLGTPESLVGQRVGVIQDSLGQAIMNLVQPQADIVVLDSLEAMIQALDQNEVDAVAGDTIVLGGLAAARGESTYRIAPAEPYQLFGVACMVPEGNSAFLNTTNYAIATLLQGYLLDQEPYAGIVDQWFGPNGIVSLPKPLIKNFFGMVLIQRSQVPPAAFNP